MVSVSFEGRRIDVAPGQTLLAACEAAGEVIESSCRSGICQTCLVQAVEGSVPELAQAGLSPALAAEGYLMSCVCVPETPMIVVRQGGARQRVEVRVRSIERLSDSVLRFRLEPLSPFSYRPGQFLALIAPNGLIRSYSIASLPGRDPYLELHVRIVAGGRMSGFIAGELAPGDRLFVQGPSGACCYDGVEPDDDIVLAGAGTGLAPLWGIAQDAVSRGHKGPIRLYHGALNARGLYLVEDLKRLASASPLFTYTACIRDEGGPSTGDLVAAVTGAEGAKPKTNFFLCGDPDLVRRLKRGLFLSGVKLDRLRADAFVPAAAGNERV